MALEKLGIMLYQVLHLRKTQLPECVAENFSACSDDVLARVLDEVVGYCGPDRMNRVTTAASV